MPRRRTGIWASQTHWAEGGNRISRFSTDWAVPVIAVLCVGPLLNSGRSAAGDTRIEHDSLGDLEIPNNQYYGVQTSRALENFPFNTETLEHFPNFINAYAST